MKSSGGWKSLVATALVGATLGTTLGAAGCAAESDSSRRGNGSTTTGDVAGASGSDPTMTGAGAGASAGTGTTGTGGTGADTATNPDPNVSTQDAPCATVGATRQCCGTGVQTCAGSAEFPVWGPCVDGLGQEVVCNSCESNEFGTGCDAGMPPPPNPPDAGTPPPPDAGTPTECGPGMECKPGAIRYCDDPVGEWSKSTCDATGHWGACVAVPVPAAAVGHGDCSDVDYSPEMCCGPAMICCQDNPGGPWVDFGSGACLAVSCP